MTKEEYLKATEDYFKKVDLAKQEFSEASIKYMESNKPFEIGEKVKVIGQYSERLGFVDGFKINALCDVVPILKKVRKDGTPALTTEHVWHSERVVKL